MKSNSLEVTNDSKTGLKVMKSNKDNKMVLYYAPWCGHCAAFHPTWEMICKKVAEKHPELDLKFVSVDCEYLRGNEEKMLGFNPEVMGYPTLRMHKKNSDLNDFEEYTGPRESSDIIEFIKSNVESVPEPNQEKSMDNKKSKKNSNKGKKKKKKSKRKKNKVTK